MVGESPCFLRLGVSAECPRGGMRFGSNLHSQGPEADPACGWHEPEADPACGWHEPVANQSCSEKQHSLNGNCKEASIG